ncbi:unnamed protein product [Dibothriocephalus latus]|uniref:Kelch repeat protein n=1 Tax=Dibothriocephalus latus TaxID=60516 RepID=A0A3P7NJV7_DIBLA|nr:unnamed protein product [Dibothriocephalus latus]
MSEVEVCHLQEPADWQQQQEQSQRKASYVFWKDAAPMLEPRKGLAAAAFRDNIFIAGGSNKQGYLSTVDVFTLPDNQRPLGEWTRLDTWDTKRPTTGLVVCADRLFSFEGALVVFPE